MVPLKGEPTNVEMRRAQRMSEAEAKEQMAAAFAPLKDWNDAGLGDGTKILGNLDDELNGV